MKPYVNMSNRTRYSPAGIAVRKRRMFLAALAAAIAAGPARGATGPAIDVYLDPG